MKTKTDLKKIEALLTRGIEQILPSSQELRQRLLSGAQLRIKHGIDPTGKKIHIGRAIVEWKLKEFQDLGHKIVLIIGDFTAQIGDPSDKLEKRPFLTKEQVKENMKQYLSQIGKIIDLKKTEVHHNGEWLAKLNLREISELAEQFTIQQMLQRRNFKDRVKHDGEISLREMFYPLMQGYDSVAIKADVELGGTDQLFNLLAGRKIQERYGQKPQIVMTTKMLDGLDGRKMSTTWGNVINIIDEPFDQYGKVMSMHDHVIPQYLELATDVAINEVAELANELKRDLTNPKLIKERVAFEVVKRYHGEPAAKKAAEKFNATFTRKETPDDIPSVLLQKKSGLLTDVLDEIKLVVSKSEARRLIEQGGVKINQKKVSDWKEKVNLKSGDVIQVGKRKFVKIS